MTDKVKDVIEALDLHRYFPDIDHDLFQLAIGEKIIDERALYRLSSKYNLYSLDFLNYQTLEFYGDTALSTVITEIMLSMNLPSNSYTKFTSNKVLTELSKSLGICHGILKAKNVTKLHNICSDSFEAILGVLFVQYGSASFPFIVKWFISLVPVQELILSEMKKL